MRWISFFDLHCLWLSHPFAEARAIEYCHRHDAASSSAGVASEISTLIWDTGSAVIAGLAEVIHRDIKPENLLSLGLRESRCEGTDGDGPGMVDSTLGGRPSCALDFAEQFYMPHKALEAKTGDDN